MNSHGQRFNERTDARIDICGEANQVIERERYEIGHSSRRVDSVKAEVAADVRIAGAADKTVPAGDQRVGCDVFSHFKFIRVRPQLHDAAAKFMTEREGRFGARMQARENAQIGAAHSTCFDLNQGFFGLWGGCVDLNGLDAVRAEVAGSKHIGISRVSLYVTAGTGTIFTALTNARFDSEPYCV